MKLGLPLLVDCDNCLSDLTGAFIKLAAEKYNVFATREQHTQYDFGPSIGCPGLEYLIDDEVLNREFCYRMEVIPEGIKFFKELEESYGMQNVFVCTKVWRCDDREKATGEWASQRYAWLRDKLGVRRNRVFMCTEKHMVPGILIDDSPEHLDKRPEGHGFCIAHPYNVSYKGPRGNYQDCLKWLKENVK